MGLRKVYLFKSLKFTGPYVQWIYNSGVFQLSNNTIYSRILLILQSLEKFMLELVLKYLDILVPTCIWSWFLDNSWKFSACPIRDFIKIIMNQDLGLYRKQELNDQLHLLTNEINLGKFNDHIIRTCSKLLLIIALIARV